MRGEEEVSLAHHDIGRTTEYLGVVAGTQLGKQHGDGVGSLALERPRDMAGLIAKFLGRLPDALPCLFGNRPVRGIVQYEGDGRSTQVEVLREHLQTNRAC